MDPKQKAKLDALSSMTSNSDAASFDVLLDGIKQNSTPQHLPKTSPSLMDELGLQEQPAGPEPRPTAFESDEIRPSHLKHNKPLTQAQLIAAEHLASLDGEGFTPAAKWDTNKPRIGHGSEDYEDGSLVKFGDTVDRDRAYDMVVNRLVRDTKTLDKKRGDLPLLKDPNVEAVTLSRMYQQGPNNVIKPGKLSGLYEALKSGKKQKFADAVKSATAAPQKYKNRLDKEAGIVMQNMIRGITGKK